jgi:hypothetical protein
MEGARKDNKITKTLLRQVPHLVFDLGTSQLQVERRYSMKEL